MSDYACKHGQTMFCVDCFKEATTPPTDELADLRAQVGTLTAERDRYREHSIDFNSFSWAVAEIAGLARPGDASVAASSAELLDELRAQVAHARLATLDEVWEAWDAPVTKVPHFAEWLVRARLVARSREAASAPASSVDDAVDLPVLPRARQVAPDTGTEQS